jgi:hypothetical protein
MTTAPASTTHDVSTPSRPERLGLSRAARAAVLIATVALAIALNAIIAAVALAAGATPGFAPLSFPVYALCTAVPLVVGWFLWRAVARRVRRPSRTMPLLALAVLVVSYVPDGVLLATGFIPGTTVAGVIALMAMHVVVIAVACVGYTLADRGAAGAGAHV